METDVKRILLQQNEALLEIQALFCELNRNQLFIIESVRSEASTESLRVAALAIREGLCSVDGLADRIRQSSQELQRQ
jgi:hypothetical protein